MDTTSPLRISIVDRVRERLRPTWVRCCLLAVMGIAVRFPALQGQLVWDDASLVRDNPFIKSPLLILETFRHHLALDGSSTHYRPVQNISYFFDYLIWNADLYGYHLSNIFWHVGSAILLYFLLLRLSEPLCARFDAPITASGPKVDGRDVVSGAVFFIALFWVIHPVHSAAVDYISGRADSLAFFFACAAWLLYLKARSLEVAVWRPVLYWCAAGLALVSLCSRESACIWMLLFLMHLFLFDRVSARKTKWFHLAACLGLVAVYAGLRQLPSDHLVAASQGLPPAQRALLMLRALGDYGQLIVFPLNLQAERTVRFSEFVSAGWSGLVSRHYLSALGLVTAAVLLYGACYRGKGQSIRICGATWFVLSYLPVSNLIQLNATVAEHWLYLPSVGFLIFVTGCWLELPLRARNVFLAFGCAAFLALSARSFVRSQDWLSSETFYRHSLVPGAGGSRIALNLAQTYADREDFARAEPLLRKVVEVNPNYAMAQNALGHLLLREGKTEEAERVFATAAALAHEGQSEQPRTWIAALNLAYMKYREGNSTNAVAILDKARGDYPGTWRLISLEAEILQAAGDNGKARQLVQEFSNANWWHSAASIQLGRIYVDMDKFQEAESVLRHASWLDVHDAEALNLIAELELRQNRLTDACATQRRAVARQPDQPRQYLFLSHILEKMGRSDEARLALNEVKRMQAVAQTGPALN